MKKTLIILTAILMLCIFGTAAAEEEQSIIGKPFPDFQTMDTEQNAFSLSDALKDHEAVLINLWASWCGPCVHEFPYLNEAYNKYKDKVAFIGLTVEPEDTLDILRDIKKENSLEYPVAPEAGTNILQHLGGGEGIPTTIIVDRFGNAVYMQVMAFRDSTEIGRLLDSFLGENYKESRALTGIPLPSETQALPVSAARTMRVENEDARRITIRTRSTDPEYDAAFGEETYTGYIVPGDTARIVMEIKAEDDLKDIVFTDYENNCSFNMFSLLDKERNEYVYDCRMADEWSLVSLGTQTGNLSIDPDFIAMYLFRNEEDIQELVEYGKEEGVEVAWEYAEEKEPEAAEKASYILHVIDQNGKPVPGVMVSFCTDQNCTMAAGDENGVITFDGEKADYHVQVLKVPEGYSIDPEFEMQTGNDREWIILVRKD